MQVATIIVSDQIKRIADAHALAAGYSTVAQYVEALILADAGEPISAELEAHLIKALDSPSIDVNADFWQKMRRESDVRGRQSP